MHCVGKRALSFQVTCPLITRISYIGLSPDLHTQAEWACARWE